MSEKVPAPLLREKLRRTEVARKELDRKLAKMQRVNTLVNELQAELLKAVNNLPEANEAAFNSLIRSLSTTVRQVKRVNDECKLRACQNQTK